MLDNLIAVDLTGQYRYIILVKPIVKNQALLEILSSWSYWDKPLPELIERQTYIPKLNKKLVLAIKGVRRCGKSTLLTQLVRHYSLDKDHCYFINFEDPRLIGSLDFTLLDQVLEVAESRHQNRELYFFFDEIQGVEGWEKWLRSRLERPRHHYIVTGSNSSLLSGEYGTVLTGRHLSVELYPLSYQEFKSYKQGSLAEYLEIGGFPEVLEMEPRDREKLLQQYFLDITEKDLQERLGSRSSLGIKKVLKMAYETQGSELSMRRLAGASGVAVETVSRILEAAENAYLLLSAPYFAYSERKSSVRNRKFYPIDSALAASIQTKVGANLGKAFETVVFLELKRRFEQVSYWRDNKSEVDFVVHHSAAIPIQVTLERPQERTEEALERFYEEHPHAAEGLILTRDDWYDQINGIE